jgi:signal transduction histidine kinase
VKFTELVATAIANAESREELTRLPEEQAALRRVATLVAQGKPHGDVFEAISAEVARLVPADAATLVRYRTDGTVETVGSWSAFGGPVPVGLRLPLSSSKLSQVILETHRPARMDRLAEAGADVSHEIGWRSAVGAPVVVEGRLWGAMDVGSKTDRPLPDETEERLTEFTALLASAIANAESRAEVDASRARIVATADATRRRIERDLHDGAQQQLLSLALEIRALRAGVPPELSQHRYELAHVADGLARVIDVLREIALGLHPAILGGEGGLGPALNTIARRSPIPVELQVGIAGRLPETVEVAAYYVVSEALTNAAKHADASNVWVDVDRHHKMVRVCVHDDGHGGADPARGSGLLGLKDRAAAIGGTIVVDSPPGKVDIAHRRAAARRSTTLVETRRNDDESGHRKPAKARRFRVTLPWAVVAGLELVDLGFVVVGLVARRVDDAPLHRGAAVGGAAAVVVGGGRLVAAVVVAGADESPQAGGEALAFLSTVDGLDVGAVREVSAVRVGIGEDQLFGLMRASVCTSAGEVPDGERDERERADDGQYRPPQRRPHLLVDLRWIDPAVQS